MLTLASTLAFPRSTVEHAPFTVADGHTIPVASAWPPATAGFASFTMDFHPGSQGAVWGKNASILEADLTNPALIGVARALSPGVLRLGGSEAGGNVTYVGFADGSTCPDDGGKPYYYCLSKERWDEIMAFSNATGARLMLDLNLMGPAT